MLIQFSFQGRKKVTVSIYQTLYIVKGSVKCYLHLLELKSSLRHFKTLVGIGLKTPDVGKT